MALVIEDGSGLPDANSYVTADELAEYALARGDDLPVEQVDQEQLLMQAMDYLEQFTGSNPSARVPAYKGSKSTTIQALLWPRKNAILDGLVFPATAIPSQLKRAQMQLAVEATSFPLMPSNSGYSVAVEQVDVLKVEYATGGRLSGATRDPAPSFPKVDALLWPLLVTISGGLRTKRI